jgi:PAS domain S-box-containing protein
MDVRMPGGGAGATRRILASYPDIAVVGLSAHEDAATAMQMLEAGASAYIVKGMPEPEILEAIRRARRGQLSMPADLGLDLVARLRDRNEAEATLRLSEERLRALIDSLPDALLIIRRDLVIEVANAPAHRLFGYAPAEIVGQHIEVLVPERFRASHERLVTGFQEHPRSRPFGTGIPLYARRKDGSEFAADISVTPMAGASASLIAEVRDLTRFVEATETGHRSEQLFHDLLESAPDAIVVIDAGGHIQVVNARTVQLFGFTREELLGLAAGEIVTRLTVAQAQRVAQSLELVGRRRDGTEFPIEVSLSTMRADENKVVIAAVRDITERKVTEKRMAETKEAAERRRLMAHLVQAQEEERRKIAADIHDDSIQAMTAASLRLQQLRKHVTTEQHQELISRLDEAVRESITRLRRLMFDLRPPTLDRTGLGPAVRELLDRLRAETEIEYTLDDRLAGEPSNDLRIELYRITQEALANVRKHSHAKQVSVELHRLDGGYHVRVADDGDGFDAQSRASRPGHLGLIAMRERATIAGGWWTIDSRLGRGTAVDFWLPDEGDAGPLNGQTPRQESPEAPR